MRQNDVIERPEGVGYPGGRSKRGQPPVFYDEAEKLDVSLTIRGPKSLADRIKKIKEHEKRLTLNKLKLNLLETGVLAYNWGIKNWKRLRALREREDEPIRMLELLPRLLDLGLELDEWATEHRDQILAIRSLAEAKEERFPPNLSRVLDAGLEALLKGRKNASE
jgi:hypothetical protein